MEINYNFIPWVENALSFIKAWVLFAIDRTLQSKTISSVRNVAKFVHLVLYLLHLV